eukprot:1133181-Pelagomonas_calceolata.AAC.2
MAFIKARYGCLRGIKKRVGLDHSAAACEASYGFQCGITGGGVWYITVSCEASHGLHRGTIWRHHMVSIEARYGGTTWPPSRHDMEAPHGLHRGTIWRHHMASIKAQYGGTTWSPSRHDIEASHGLHQGTMWLPMRHQKRVRLDHSFTARAELQKTVTGSWGEGCPVCWEVVRLCMASHACKPEEVVP